MTDNDEALADWAERDMTLSPRSKSALRGSAAAEHGRAALGGRPSIDPTAQPGEHARNRQVRLAADVDRRLQELADQQHRTASAVMRDAVAEYLSAHAG